MSLIPWKYCNPYTNLKYDPLRNFSFNGVNIKIKQNLNNKISLESNTGNVVWDGAYILARYIEKKFLHNPNSISKPLFGMKCLELGSGTGLVGLVAWLNGANVIVTDLENQITLIQENITKNCTDCDHSIRVTSLDWAAPNLEGSFDVILGSEIVYLASAHLSLLKTLKRYCQPGHTQIILSYQARNLGEDRFFSLAQSMGFILVMVPRNQLDPEFQNSTTYQIVSLRLPKNHN